MTKFTTYVATNKTVYLIDNKLSKYKYSVDNPRNNKHEGHFALEHHETYRISLALCDSKVITDYREPNVIRLTLKDKISFFSVVLVLDIDSTEFLNVHCKAFFFYLPSYHITLQILYGM